MIRRCEDPEADAFPRYGGRGIRVCPEWHDYDRFVGDMGIPEKGMTLDRIDGDGDYCPENCRWATKSEQQRNTSRTVYATVDGIRKPLRTWAEEMGLNYSVVKHRMYSEGLSPEDSLLTKAQRDERDGVVKPPKEKRKRKYISKTEKNDVEKVFSRGGGFGFECLGEVRTHRATNSTLGGERDPNAEGNC